MSHLFKYMPARLDKGPLFTHYIISTFLANTSTDAVGPRIPEGRWTTASLGRKKPLWLSPAFSPTLNQRLPCEGIPGRIRRSIEAATRSRRRRTSLYVKESFEVANEEGAKKAARYHIV